MPCEVGTILLMLLAAAAAPEAARGEPAPAAGARVRAELLADVAAVAPGGEFTLGVRMRLAPGWHVYWRNPGDTGVATAVEFELPEGFRAGPIQWPVPRAFAEGPLTAFGYEEEVLLLAKVQAPAARAGEAARLRARVSWLACREQCVPGEAELALTLPVAGATAGERGANAELFRRWEARIPVEAGGAGSPARARVEGPGGGPGAQPVMIELDWRDEPAEVAAFAAAEPAVSVTDWAATTEGRRTQVSFRVRVLPGQKAAVPAMPVVVAYTNAAGARRGVSVSVPLP